MMSKIWKLKPVDMNELSAVIEHTQLPTAAARVLVLNDHKTPAQIDTFLNTKLSALADPFLLPDMRKAVDRIWTAIESNETISIFGDYDVDGVTSNALLTRFLTALKADVKPFIPSRMDEGYGLSQDALDRCIEEHKPAVLITVDCGINSVESTKFAQGKGIDVIVTDHHEPDEEVAPAFALINPKVGDHPEFEILSGVGVAFKLAHAMLKEGRARKNALAEAVELREYLDIVALGTVADLVPLINENRTMVHHGLVQLDRSRWEGFRALKAVSGIRDQVTTFHLGFQLGPRINAAGRIGTPMQALRLLTTDDATEARDIAQELDKVNKERRAIELDMVTQAFEEIDAYFDPKKHFVLIVAHEDWHPGVVGIVASRIARHYHRPAIVMGIIDGAARGSCRGIEEFDMLDGLRQCESILTKFGGHKMAAGLELPAESLAEFRATMGQIAYDDLSVKDLSPVRMIDATLFEGELNWGFLEQLNRLGPFGQNNPEPIFALLNVQRASPSMVVGGKHLKMTLSVGGQKFDAIAFNFPKENVPDGALDLAFTIKENTWRGNTQLQLQILDMRPAQPLIGSSI